MGAGWNFSNTYLLVLMSLGYIVGELAHFLINTTSRFDRHCVTLYLHNHSDRAMPGLTIIFYF
jgi:hypothetical protein